ncbi:MAG TPA: hypothetical protein VJQ84_06130 [Solirubrobacterales bacterium]|nr:hypothetical protein [Solirubrobacterales bacterium]
MTSIRRRAKALGLTLLSLSGLAAVFAGGALATWLVEGKELTTNETVALKAVTTQKIVVEKKNLEIQCTVAAGEGITLVAKSATAEGKAKFSGCTTFSPIGSGKESKNCKPKEPIVVGGKVLLILHESKNYALFEPATAGGKFSTLEFSELCALTESGDVTGSMGLYCEHKVGGGPWLELSCDITGPSHELAPASEALFPSDVLKFGANTAKVSGDVSLELSGANTGKSWAGHV